MPNYPARYWKKDNKELYQDSLLDSAHPKQTTENNFINKNKHKILKILIFQHISLHITFFRLKYNFQLNKFSVKMSENSENVSLEPSSDDKVVEKVETTSGTDEKIMEEADGGAAGGPDTNETGKMSSKSSDISIEEINAEGETVEKSENAEIPIEEIGEEIPIEEIGAEEEIIEKTENAEILIPEVVPESPKDIVKIEPARIESISDDDEDEDEDDVSFFYSNFTKKNFTEKN